MPHLPLSSPFDFQTTHPQSSLSQKQFRLDSALRQLGRNINEVEKGVC